jgi:hypothetical protein
MSYNGWKNYETWAVKLWLDNDESLYHTAMNLVEDEHEDASDLADSIQSFIDEIAPEVTGLFSDLLNSALSEVDWVEIAESYISDWKDGKHDN